VPPVTPQTVPRMFRILAERFPVRSSRGSFVPGLLPGTSRWS
jgi:hypothetical protein